MQINWELVTSVVLGGGIVGMIVAAMHYAQMRRQNHRQGLFDCLNAYLRIMEYRDSAEKSKDDDEYFRYLRALFDLQWAEFHMWMRKSLPDAPYREWLKQRGAQFTGKLRCRPSGEPGGALTYRDVWDRLKGEYFDPSDPFLVHMDLVHAGNIEEAIEMRKAESWTRRLSNTLAAIKAWIKSEGVGS